MSARKRSAATFGLRCFPEARLQDLRYRRHCQVLRKGWREVRRSEQDQRRPPKRSRYHPEQAGEPHHQHAVGKARRHQGRQMLRASEAGLLAGLFPSPAFGTRSVQSAIRKAAIKSVQGECRTKMLAFLYDRTEATDAIRNLPLQWLSWVIPFGEKRQLQGSVHHDACRCVQHREGNRRCKERTWCGEEPAGVPCFY